MLERKARSQRVTSVLLTALLTFHHFREVKCLEVDENRGSTSWPTSAYTNAALPKLGNNRRKRGSTKQRLRMVQRSKKKNRVRK